MQTICPHCKQIYEVETSYEGEEFSCGCGKNFSAENIKYCAICGTPVPASTQFCVNCGYDFNIFQRKLSQSFLFRNKSFILTIICVALVWIGIAFAISIPVSSQARKVYREIECINNLKRIGLAVSSYQSDFDRFPTAENKAEFINLVTDIGYLTEVEKYLHCLEDNHKGTASYVYLRGLPGINFPIADDGMPVFIEKPGLHDGYVHVLLENGEIVKLAWSGNKPAEVNQIAELLLRYQIVRNDDDPPGFIRFSKKERTHSFINEQFSRRVSRAIQTWE